MAITIKAKDVGTSSSAIKFYEKYKDAFGIVMSAEMKSTPVRVEYELTLVNDKGDEMEFVGECTSGYVGAGPNVTYDILKLAGFDIDQNFISNNSSFKIEK